VFRCLSPAERRQPHQQAHNRRSNPINEPKGQPIAEVEAFSSLGTVAVAGVASVQQAELPFVCQMKDLVRSGFLFDESMLARQSLAQASLLPVEAGGRGLRCGLRPARASSIAQFASAD